MNKMQERDKFNTSCRKHSVEITIDQVTRHIAWKRDECPVCRIIRLEQQLSEARAEVERLKERMQANAAKIDDEDVVVEWKDYVRLKEEARKQAAQEIVEMMGGWPLSNAMLAQCRQSIRQRYGLEGEG